MAVTIMLNHTIVPSRDKAAAAKFFADIFGLKRGRGGHFAPVRINKSLTLLFSDEDPKFESHHYAFHVTNREFEAILRRVKKANIAFGSAPWSLEDGELNDWNGGRGVYFRDPDGHVLELMTAPQ
jgi:catechol 2,3-dioxygenase-like lactoylglutathione lyase family enzyme